MVTPLTAASQIPHDSGSCSDFAVVYHTMDQPATISETETCFSENSYFPMRSLPQQRTITVSDE
jgi:hypothetical protein